MPRKSDEKKWLPRYYHNRCTRRKPGDEVIVAADLPPAKRLALTKIGKGKNRRPRKAVVLGPGTLMRGTYRVRVEGVAGELCLDAGLLETLKETTNNGEKERAN